MTARAMKMRLKVVEQEEWLEKDAGHQGVRQAGGEISRMEDQYVVPA
jgi:hypothetical protein